MTTLWIEKKDGYFYPNSVKGNPAVWAKLQMLILEGTAEEDSDGVLISFDKAVSVSEEDASLLNFPSRNPYRISIRTSGDLAHSNLKYILEILQPNGKPFVRPTFNGALVHLDEETIYRLSYDQYQLVCLTKKSNDNLSTVNRREVLGYNLANAYHIQQHAGKVEAKLDNTLSENNGKIVLADRLDVDFQDNNDGAVTVAPILLTEDSVGNIRTLDDDTVQDFQNAFNNRSIVKDVYMGKERTRYVCTENLQKGLQQIKTVRKLSKNDAERYKKQPKELFTEDVFALGQARANSANVRSTDIMSNTSSGNWLPAEGDYESDFEVEVYSSRVDGIEEVKSGSYFGNSGRKPIDWLSPEGYGDTEDKGRKPLSDVGDETTVAISTSETNMPNDNCSEVNTNIKDDNVNDSQSNTNVASDMADIDMIPVITPKRAKRRMYQLKIKPNFEQIDYEHAQVERENNFIGTALLPHIKLLQHQEKGIEWMLRQWENGYQGVLLADDMGLGKTLQTLAFIGGLKKTCTDNYEMLKKPILIVAPTALLANWQSEYEKFLQKGIFKHIISLQGQNLKKYQTGDTTPNNKKKLLLNIPDDSLAMTTYETLRDYQFSFAEVKWSIIIADEVQKIKNPVTGVTNAIKAMQYDYTVCLSGTPVENSWIDLWSIMDFVQPACIGELRTFKQNYVDVLTKIGDDKRQIEIIGQRLKSNLSPLFLRRMKKDYLSDMPQKHVYSCKEEMPEYQKQRYVSVIKYTREHEVHPLQVIAKLRDISLHPDLGTKPLNAFYSMDYETIINQSARLKKTFTILAEVKKRNEKALIFLVSKKMQLVVAHLIEEKFGINVLPPVNGDMNGNARQKIVDKFSMLSGFNVLILSPEAAGVGFTITSANNVIHLSRTWNPAKEEQATDRAYRIGQTKDVNVYLPMACHKDFGVGGSFDEKLDELLTYKRTLSENVLFPTGDSSKDGMKIYQDISRNNNLSQEMCYWKITDIDAVIGDVFEQIIADLYNTMDGYKAEKTPATNDDGADVVAIYSANNTGLLIQCKHTETPDKTTMSKKPIQEITAAIKSYENRPQYRGIKFTPLVITNAMRFSDGAAKLAAQNGVKLIARGELSKMFSDNNVLKHY